MLKRRPRLPLAAQRRRQVMPQRLADRRQVVDERERALVGEGAAAAGGADLLGRRARGHAVGGEVGPAAGRTGAPSASISHARASYRRKGRPSWLKVTSCAYEKSASSVGYSPAPRPRHTPSRPSTGCSSSCGRGGASGRRLSGYGYSATT